MTSPLTEQQLHDIETRAASLHEYATLDDEPFQADADQLTGEDVPALVAEIRRLRAELDQMRAARDVIASLHRDADARLDAVTALCDREQRNAERREHPLAVPEWVTAVRLAARPTTAVSAE